MATLPASALRRSSTLPTSLLGGGGVDGAIHRAGGSEILEACREIRRTTYPQGLATGEAVITPAGDLSARYVIHTVGPVYGRHDGHEPELLAACYENSLRLAEKHFVQTVAFPAISTGVYGYPQNEAARVASRAIAEFLGANETIAEVRLIYFKASDADIFLENQCLEP